MYYVCEMWNKSYNRLTKEYRVKRYCWSNQKFLVSDEMYFTEIVYKDLARKIPPVGYSDYWFVDVPYRPYLVWCICWFLKPGIIKIWNVLKRDNYNNLKWLVATTIAFIAAISKWQDIKSTLGL